MEKSCADCKWCVRVENKSGNEVMLCMNDEDGDYMVEVGYCSGEDCEGFESDYSEETCEEVEGE